MKSFFIWDKEILIDDEDWKRISLYCWHLAPQFRQPDKYKVRGEIDGKKVFLHRFIMNFPKSCKIDHINGDTLDNRKCNLRICTQAENAYNRKINSNNKSGFKGVHFKRANQKWCAQIQFNRKSIHLGYFNDKLQAAKAYDTAAIKLFGVFAKLNFSERQK